MIYFSTARLIGREERKKMRSAQQNYILAGSEVMPK